MAEIRIIFFDVGGVLLTNGWDHTERAAVLEHFSVDRAGYEQRHEAANDPWEKGLITAEQFLDRTVFFEPRPFSSAEFLAAMKAQSKILPNGAMSIVRKLRASGQVKLAVLSNESRELNDYRIERFHLRDFFDAFFSSCYLGLRKPDPKIFRLALDVMQVNAEEAVFVDDRQENCAAAQDVGMRAIRYQDEAQLDRELDHPGIPA